MRSRPNKLRSVLVAAAVLLVAAGTADAQRDLFRRSPTQTSGVLLPTKPSSNSRAIPLPTVSPPLRSGVPVRWNREVWTLASSSESFPAGQAVVGVDDGVNIEALARRFGVVIVQRDPTLQAAVVSGTPEALSSLNDAALFESGLRYVEPLRRLRFLHQRSDPLTYELDSRTGQPYAWNFKATHVDKALNLSVGSPTTLVGIVDSGFAPVVDLAGKYAKGWYFTAETTTPFQDAVGHGTFVASMIASNNDDGKGLAGFCGACRLDVFRNVFLYDSQVATAIRQLADDGVRIINLSLGGSPSLYVNDAIGYAISKGVLVIAASGNDGAGSVSYPAAFLQPDGGGPSYGLAVGASDENGNRASYSNYGSRLSLLAPATLSLGCSFGVFGALPGPTTSFACDHQYYTDSTTGAAYTYGQGTSFAAPEVAGVAALVWAARPDLRNYQVAELIKQAASRPAGAAWNPVNGWGVLDAARALELATGRSSADSVRASVMGHPEAIAGQRFTVSGRAVWQDSVPVITGSVGCNAATRGRTLPGTSTGVNEGSFSCSWELPSWTAGHGLTFTVTARDVDGNSGPAEGSAAVKDATGPTSKALASRGKYAHVVMLRYGLQDDSGEARARIDVYAGARRVDTVTRPFRETSGAGTYEAPWHAPKRPREIRRVRRKFCVTGIDHAGNRGARTCAAISLS